MSVSSMAAANPPDSSALRNASPRQLLQAPHRLFFFTGTSLLCLSLLWWTWDLAARYLPTTWSSAPAWLTPIAIGVGPGWLHAIVLIYGAFSAYIFGFSLTAMPKWLGRAPVPGDRCAPLGVLLLAGAVLALAGFVAVGVALMLAGWSGALYMLWTRVFRGAHPDKRHAALIVTALVCGWLGLSAALAACITAEPVLFRAAVVIGLWVMLLPVNLVVAHRMLPFFTSSVFPGLEPWRPFTPLYVLIGACVTLGVAGAAGWLIVAAGAAAVALTITVLFAWRWHVAGVSGNRMLLMLHVGHAWLPIAFALYVVQSVAAVFGAHWGGLAPLHALTMGFLLSTAVAMVSRVSLGHSGRRVAADTPTWWVFWAVQLAVLLRIFAEVATWPTGWVHPYVPVAAASALTVLVWAGRYLPIYLTPRADGGPG